MSATDEHTRKPCPGDAETHIDAIRAIAVTLDCVRDALLSKGGVHDDQRLAQSIGFLSDELERNVGAIEEAIFPGCGERITAMVEDA